MTARALVLVLICGANPQTTSGPLSAAQNAGVEVHRVPLPRGIEFRFVGKDLVLLDQPADVILDYMRNVIP